MTAEAIKQYTLAEAERLRLGDWELDVRVVEKVDAEGSDGSCQWLTDMHQATILIRAGMSETETKWTVRHELMHLRLEGHRPWKGHDAMYEWGINCISKVWG